MQTGLRKSKNCSNIMKFIDVFTLCFARQDLLPNLFNVTVFSVWHGILLMYEIQYDFMYKIQYDFMYNIYNFTYKIQYDFM